MTASSDMRRIEGGLSVRRIGSEAVSVACTNSARGRSIRSGPGAPVLRRFGALDHHRAQPTELSATLDGRVRPLDGLHGQDDLFPDHQALADVETPQIQRESPAEIDVFPLPVRGFPAGEDAFRREEFRRVEVGGHDGHAVTFEFGGQCAQQRVVAAAFDGEEEAGGAPIRTQVQGAGLVDGAGHDHMGDTVGREEFNEAAELTKLEPCELVAIGNEGRVSVRSEADSDDLLTAGLGRPGNGDGEGAPARDDAKGSGHGQG